MIASYASLESKIRKGVGFTLNQTPFSILLGKNRHAVEMRLQIYSDWHTPLQAPHQSPLSPVPVVAERTSCVLW